VFKTPAGIFTADPEKEEHVERGVSRKHNLHEDKIKNLLTKPN
jgi:hypothetical protein